MTTTDATAMRIKFLLFGFVILMFTGCRSYRHYGFKHAQYEVWKGQLHIDVVGEPKDYSTDGKNYQDWGNPYHLLFTYYFPNTERVEKIEISDLVLVGLGSRKEFRLSSREGTKKTDVAKFFDKNDQRFYFSLAFSDLRDHQLIYEPYLLSCVVHLHAEGKVLAEKKIEVMLETDFKKGNRSDTYDAMMGI